MNAMRRVIAWLSLVFLAAHPAAAENVQLEEAHGVYMVPVRINDAITIPFILDSGAGDISVPEDVFKTLLRTRTVTESDFLAPGTYVIADGSKHLEARFVLHELRVGDQVVKDVIASVAPDKADPLLGQNFLKKLPTWTIDNTRHTLVFGNAAPLPPATVEGPTRPLGPTIAPALPGTGLTIAEIMKRAAAAQWGGFNVPKDYAGAMRWYRLAADQGDAEAQNEIGRMYLKGQGVPQAYAQAMRRYRKAANQGLAKAKDNIGYLYARGLGVPQDCAVATKWTGRVATVLCDLPRVGDCVNTTIKWIGTRLTDGSGAPIPDSGSAIQFTNGGYQVSYGTVPGIEQSRVGDPVQMCLEAVPQNCPIGDDRGRIYHIANLRTHQSWSEADAQHGCGGA
jgi:gag-polyprotein putative aspartyl protease/Sel1 repeat